MGGHRICLGKTFAETVAKKMIAMILKFYSLELSDHAMKKEQIGYDILQKQTPKICYKFNKRTYSPKGKWE